MKSAVGQKVDASGLRIALIAARFNDEVAERLLTGARHALLDANIRHDDVTEIRVPGAWELPLAAKAAARSGRFDALVCLGCVIRGETAHHRYVAGGAERGLAEVSLEFNLPIGFGVLTTDTLEQALHRAAADAGNKGAEAARSAVEMVHLLRSLGSAPRGKP